eukprot:CAMPEP_0195516224 /NCGR_PEP_ID=MMETSP0794_2-20130614/7014_1 /TAXON_ID=515487 /ORGANISM="Stephanopyxis turris, Strain CCMP 815" /LENGTH=269 /DNA_ID=CAMNT_0040644767 /DNA_START=114 /DNA_END=923 /DNA_ORIENTATION=-
MINSIASSKIFDSWVSKVIVGFLAFVTTTRYGVGLLAWRAANKLESPKYTVVAKLTSGIELRQYEPYLVAETSVEKDGFRESTGDGFRTVAAYIFGENNPRGGRGESSEKMAMTAPVRVSGSSTPSERKIGEKMAMTSPVRSSSSGKSAGGKTKVSFVIGSKYSLKSAPKPVDPNVNLFRVPTHFLAVRRFAGRPPSDSRVRQERERIEGALKDANLVPASEEETFVYGYHDPFMTPNFLRRNEVGVMVEASSVTPATGFFNRIFHFMK